jgi:hypothetical protein
MIAQGAMSMLYKQFEKFTGRRRLLDVLELGRAF